MFASIDDVIARFAEQRYICNRRIATVVYLATHLEKPILVEGPAGVGKTELAKVVAAALGLELIRLQCYEGLDEAKALYEWEYAKQLLYTQILKDKISEVIGGATSLREAVDRIAKQDDVFFSDRFILPRPLLRSITSAAAHRAADRRDRQVRHRVRGLPARGAERLHGQRARARHPAREAHPDRAADQQQRARDVGRAQAPLPAPLHRLSRRASRSSRSCASRCPASATTLAAQVVEAVQRIRKLDLKKSPSISETLDWAKTLTLLNAEQLDEELVNDTLSTILKYEGDIRKAQDELKAYLQSAARAARRSRATTRTCCTERGRRMDAKIVEFTALLRANGLRVSMAEHLDAFQAVAALGIGDRESFKDALRATMVKRAVDVPVYDELFDLYFSGLGEAIRESAERRSWRRCSSTPQEFQQLMDQLAEMLEDLDVDLSELAQALLQNDTGRLEQMLRDAARAGATRRASSARTRRGATATARRRASASAGSAEELDALKEQLGQRRPAAGARRAAAAVHRPAPARSARDDPPHRAHRAGEARSGAARAQSARRRLAEKSFYYLSEDEMRRMREAVTKLAQRLKNVVSIRRKRGKRGKFDLNDTLRKNLQYGGVPFRIQFDRRITRQAAGDGAVRRLRLGAQRVALHAAVRLLAAGSLLARAQLHLRQRDRRDHAAVRGARDAARRSSRR